MKTTIKRISLSVMLGLVMVPTLCKASVTSLKSQIAQQQQMRMQVIMDIAQSFADAEIHSGPAMQWSQAMQARKNATLAQAQVSQLQYLLQQEQALTVQIKAYKAQQKQTILESPVAL